MLCNHLPSSCTMPSFTPYAACAGMQLLTMHTFLYLPILVNLAVLLTPLYRLPYFYLSLCGCSVLFGYNIQHLLVAADGLAFDLALLVALLIRPLQPNTCPFGSCASYFRFRPYWQVCSALPVPSADYGAALAGCEGGSSCHLLSHPFYNYHNPQPIGISGHFISAGAAAYL